MNKDRLEKESNRIYRNESFETYSQGHKRTWIKIGEPITGNIIERIPTERYRIERLLQCYWGISYW